MLMSSSLAILDEKRPRSKTAREEPRKTGEAQNMASWPRLSNQAAADAAIREEAWRQKQAKP